MSSQRHRGGAVPSWSALARSACPDPSGRMSPAARHAMLVELDRRCASGTFVYVPLFVGVAIFVGLFTRSPLVTTSMTVAFLGIGVTRFVQHRRFTSLLERDPVRLERRFTALLLINSLVVGVVLVLATVLPSFGPGLQPLIQVAGMVCTSATVTMAIHPLLRRWVPIMVLAPYTACLVITLDTAHALSLVFVACYSTFLFQISRRVHDDYWNAVARGTELAEQASRLKRLSETDTLTQVANRLHVDRELQTQWARSRASHETLSLLLLDVDHFKTINDRYGHPVGDRCLREIAGALVRGAQRDTDLVARWGGEEFLVLLPDTPAADAVAVAERLRNDVAALCIVHGDTQLYVTCSIGLASVDGDWMAEHGSATAVAMADAALYRAKQDGRDRVETVSV